MYLMLADKEVLEFNSAVTSYRVINPELLPYPLYYVQRSTEFIEDIRKWLSHRFIYKNLKNYKAIMNSLSMEQQPSYNLKLILRYHALAVTDSYWVRLTSEETFDSLDLHNIPLKETVIDVALLGIFSTLQLSDMKANVDLRGTFAKTWVRRNDGLHLYKTCLDKDSNVYSELYAQLFINQMPVESCNYSNSIYKGYNCTDSKCFTTKDKMLVHAVECNEYLKHHKIQSVQQLFPEEFAKMTLADYIIGNTDRHFENYGVMVDSSTNQILQFAPLYDHNLSMEVTKIINTYLRSMVYKPTGKSFLESAIDAYEYLKGDFPLEYKYAPDYVEERLSILKANVKSKTISFYNDSLKYSLDEFVKESGKTEEDFIKVYSEVVTDTIMKHYSSIVDTKEHRAYLGYCLVNGIKPKV